MPSTWLHAWRDWRGTEVRVGSTVVWAVAGSGSSLSMNEGNVLEIIPHQTEHPYDEDYKTRSDYCRRCVFGQCPGFNLRVMPSRTVRWGVEKRAPRPVTLTAIERVTVLNELRLEPAVESDDELRYK